MKLIYLLFIILYSFHYFGQEKKIRIITADKLEYNKNIKDAQQLIGNVVFEHDSAYMYCDTALLYSTNNSFEAFSNVKIIQGDSVKITGDSILYLGKEKTAQLKGNVFFTDGKLNLKTEQLDYNITEKKGYYTNKAIITSIENNNILVSNIGSYFSNSKTFFFKDSVKLTNPKYVIESDTLIYNTQTEIAFFHGATTINSDSNNIYCEKGWYDTKKEKSSLWKNSYIQTKEQKLSGDSIYYDRILGIGKVFGNVVVQDTTNKTNIKGGYAFYNEIEDSSLVTENPIFIQYFDTDTLHLTADTLTTLQDTTTKLRTFRAYKNVIVYKPDLQANCDSLVYSETDSTMHFISNPIIWSDENQITGDTIIIKTFRGIITNLYIKNKATIVSEADSINNENFNQIQGKNIEGLFNKKNKLETVFVKGNGEVIYFMGEDKKPITDMNHTQCSEMTIKLKENQIDRVKFYTKPKASLKPIININKDDKKLSQFNWNTDKRPKSYKDLIR